jgi:protein ImuB
MTRTLVVTCGDWPVRALGVPAGEPAAVLAANRVLAVTPAARRAGVRPGLRRREAQARCPGLTVLDRDPVREGRAFEPVVAAVERFAPLVEVSEPGTCAVATRGPSRYHGGDEALARAVQGSVREVLGLTAEGPSRARGGCRVGVADGWFAAAWAARRSARAYVVPPGASAAFLAPLPLGALEQPDLVEVLGQLGLRVLGDLAALPEADVLGRFGPVGVHAHRLARGGDDRPLDARRPPPELAASRALDPPLERVDQAAFVVRGMAEELAEHLGRLGLACTRLAVEAATEHDESLVRLWRDEGALTPGAMVERARWQLDGWLSGPAAQRPTGGLVRLALVPHEVVPAKGRQLGFWGGESQAAERATRALARAAALLGADAVGVPERRGGRGADEQVDLVPLGAVDHEGRQVAPLAAPWPGRLPCWPASVAVGPVAAEVLDAQGRPVTVSGRAMTSAPPARVRVGEGPLVAVRAWAGPWPVEERWWDADAHRRQARLQVVLEGGAAHLLVLEGGTWACFGTYD